MYKIQPRTKLTNIKIMTLVLAGMIFLTSCTLEEPQSPSSDVPPDVPPDVTAPLYSTCPVAGVSETLADASDLTVTVAWRTPESDDSTALVPSPIIYRNGVPLVPQSFTYTGLTTSTEVGEGTYEVSYVPLISGTSTPASDANADCTFTIVVAPAPVSLPTAYTTCPGVSPTDPPTVLNDMAMWLTPTAADSSAIPVPTVFIGLQDVSGIAQGISSDVETGITTALLLTTTSATYTITYPAAPGGVPCEFDVTNLTSGSQDVSPTISCLQTPLTQTTSASLIERQLLIDWSSAITLTDDNPIAFLEFTATILSSLPSSGITLLSSDTNSGRFLIPAEQVGTHQLTLKLDVEDTDRGTATCNLVVEITINLLPSGYTTCPSFRSASTDSPPVATWPNPIPNNGGTLPSPRVALVSSPNQGTATEIQLLTDRVTFVSDSSMTTVTFPDSGNLTYRITYEAIEDANSCRFDVTIAAPPNVSPVVTCPAAPLEETISFSSMNNQIVSFVWEDSGVTVMDDNLVGANVEITITSSSPANAITIEDSNNFGTGRFIIPASTPADTYTLNMMFRAEDVANAVDSCTFTIMVTITSSPAGYTYCPSEDNDITVTGTMISWALPVSSDGNPLPTPNILLESLDLSTAGFVPTHSNGRATVTLVVSNMPHTIIYAAADSENNCTFTVTPT